MTTQRYEPVLALDGEGEIGPVWIVRDNHDGSMVREAPPRAEWIMFRHRSTAQSACDVLNKSENAARYERGLPAGAKGGRS